MSEPVYKGEAVLLNWNDNKSGRKIVLQLEKDGPGSHPFDGLDGERFAVVIVGPLASDDHKIPRRQDTRGITERGEGRNGVSPEAPPPPLANSLEGAATREDADGPRSGEGLSAATRTPSAKSPRKWADMPPSSRAALLCKEPEFWEYLDAIGYLATCEETASSSLKTILHVEKRAEIVEGSRAAAELSRIIGNYRAYLQAKGHEQCP